MPFTDSKTLKVFLSYASEDGEIARALTRGLRAAFPTTIEITVANEFPAGQNWRDIIDTSLEMTDVLIVIATGRLKPGFSFTGYEIGYFSRSIQEQPNMRLFQHLNRRTIPFAVLSNIPDPVKEMEGININPAELRAIYFQPQNLGTIEPDLSQQSHASIPDHEVFRLLDDIETLLKQTPLGGGNVQTLDQTEQRSSVLKQVARDICLKILDKMQERIQSENRPKSKLVVRLKPVTLNSHDEDLLSGATLEMVGPCFEIFGFSEPVQGPITWTAFTSRVGDNDVKYAWHEAISSLVQAARRDKFDDNTVLMSFDKKTAFRIFASKVVQYYSRIVEVHLYLVSTLKKRSYGDHITSMLLRSAEIALQYRFLFLEQGMNFAPEVFLVTPLDKIKSRVLDMTSELNILLHQAEDFGLSDPEIVLSIMGAGNTAKITEYMVVWQEQKDKLYSTANRLLGAKDVPELMARRVEFISSLRDFCKNTRIINCDYTTRVLQALENRIREQEGISVSA